MLAVALRAAGIAHVPGPDRTFAVDTLDGRVTAEMVARAALDRQVLLTELRSADSAGIEQLFFSLTAGEPTHPKEVAAA
jgi:ABC-2 type transport system ATP-binding protein